MPPVAVEVRVGSVTAAITVDHDWTPELLATLLRQCGDEVVRILYPQPSA